jgi:hypothetical protein
MAAVGVTVFSFSVPVVLADGQNLNGSLSAQSTEHRKYSVIVSFKIVKASSNTSDRQ